MFGYLFDPSYVWLRAIYLDRWPCPLTMAKKKKPSTKAGKTKIAEFTLLLGDKPCITLVIPVDEWKKWTKTPVVWMLYVAWASLGRQPTDVQKLQQHNSWKKADRTVQKVDKGDTYRVLLSRSIFNVEDDLTDHPDKLLQCGA